MNLYRVLDKTAGIGFMVVAEDWADVPALIDALEVQWYGDSALTTMVAADVMEEPQVLTAFRIRVTNQTPVTPGSRNNGRKRNAEYLRRRRAKKREKQIAREAAEA